VCLYYDWFFFFCVPRVNTICYHILICLSLLWSASKHNMWSYYDWVVVVVRQWTQYVVVLWLGCRCCLPLLTDDNNDNPIIIRPHIMFTDGRQQRHPNHNTTTYCVYWRWTQYVVVLWLGCRCCLPSVSTIFGGIMIGLSLLSSVSKHNVWSYYDWVVVVFRQ
jgi:hypothetical protein